MTDCRRPPTYADTGVDLARGDAFVSRVARLSARTRRPEVLGGIGGFAGLFALGAGRWRDPVVVSGTDGVGTKLDVARALDRHDTIGVDLVAMCVNDVLTAGAEPLFFLDYFATGRLDVALGEAVMRGIAEGCAQAGCALVGGEASEMPGFYAEGRYDLAGFAVGVVERDAIIDGSAVRPGHVILGLPSSGLHANGYSLARHVLLGPSAPPLDPHLGALLLAPTRIYTQAVRSLLGLGLPIHAMAHITGGGLPGNIPRALPEGCRALLDTTRWMEPEVFDWLRRATDPPIEERELQRTFNLGIGFVLIVPPDVVDPVVAHLVSLHEPVHRIGVVREGERGCDLRAGGL